MLCQLQIDLFSYVTSNYLRAEFLIAANILAGSYGYFSFHYHRRMISYAELISPVARQSVAYCRRGLFSRAAVVFFVFFQRITQSF